MPFDVEEYLSLVKLVTERPDLQAELRRLLLTEEIRTLPALVRDLVEAQKRTETRVSELAAAQSRTEARMEELAAAQARTEVSIRRLIDDVGELKGDNLQRKYAERAYSYFGAV